MYRKTDAIQSLMIIAAFISFMIPAAALAQNEKKLIRQGNNRYSDAKYPESETLYRKAIEKNNASSDAVFNLGDALYKQNKYEEAGKQFSVNANAEQDKLKRSYSFYNLGNSLLKNNKIGESIEAYKNSLKLNPGNMEAKYNLAFAQDLLNKQQQQQQQQQEDQQDNQNQEKQEGSQGDNEQGGQEKPDQQKEEKDKKQQPQQTISKEDAQRLLDALANDEKKVQDKVNQAKAAKSRVRTLINW